jgi:hypothetical protein
LNQFWDESSVRKNPKQFFIEFENLLQVITMSDVLKSLKEKSLKRKKLLAQSVSYEIMISQRNQLNFYELVWSLGNIRYQQCFGRNFKFKSNIDRRRD